jgi:hypothetical protein
VVCDPSEALSAYVVALPGFPLHFLQCQIFEIFIDSAELALQGEFHYSNKILNRKWNEDDKQTVEV